MRVGKLTDVVAVVVLLGYTVAWSGFVLSVLWAWFVVPTFGVREISIPVALGLALFVYTINGGKGGGKGRKEEVSDGPGFTDVVAELFVLAAKYALILSAAWLIKGCM